MNLNNEDEILEEGIILNDLEMKMLKDQDKKLVSSFKSTKLEKEAKKMWDLFYKRNTTNFFKDRRWMLREFDEMKKISSQKSEVNEKVTFLECGCGVGNTFFPLKEEIENLYVNACDFSSKAVQLIKENPKFDNSWLNVFEFDLALGDLSKKIPENSVDVSSLIFVLSAVHPDNFSTVFTNIYKVLKPGGLLIFRDYGINDWAMLRFKPGSKISEGFYVRQDGTRAYYFEKNEIIKLVENAGFKVFSNDYVLRKTENKKEDVCVSRIFLQGKFYKPNQQELNRLV